LMNGAPPLVYFTLGALYNKIGDHKSAVGHLVYVLENENADESTYNYPSPDLRNYVRILRKIEREPAEAPQTSAAIRSLERARRNRGKVLLESSQILLKEFEAKKQAAEISEKKQREIAEKASEKVFISVVQNEFQNIGQPQNGKDNTSAAQNTTPQNNGENSKRKKSKNGDDPFASHTPISEVLRDIYDSK